MALVLSPVPPLPDWLADLDALTRRAPAFFSGRPVILDLTAMPLHKPELTELLADLLARGIRIMGIEGGHPSAPGPGLPPRLVGGRPIADIAGPEDEAGALAETPPEPAPGPPAPPASLLLESPVRSGQSILFPEGDVTVIGSVASGAEIVAGGSIHIYGALRGRALAGSPGNSRARIYCRKLEAELLAIDGLYKTAEDMDTQFRGRPVQARLDGDAIVMTALD